MILADRNNFESTQQYAIVEANKPKEIAGSIRPAQTDFSREALNSYLESTFVKYGIADKLPEAEYVTFKESSWIWDNGNSISKGLEAFTPNTWKLNCKQFGNYQDLNPYAQINCMALMWSRSEWTQWETWCNKYGIGLTKCDWANKKTP